MAGIVESDGFLAPGRACDFGRLRPLVLHRVPPAAPEGGVFRGDGFGDEYGGGLVEVFGLFFVKVNGHLDGLVVGRKLVS